MRGVWLAKQHRYFRQRSDSSLLLLVAATVKRVLDGRADDLVRGEHERQTRRFREPGGGHQALEQFGLLLGAAVHNEQDRVIGSLAQRRQIFPEQGAQLAS